MGKREKQPEPGAGAGSATSVAGSVAQALTGTGDEYTLTSIGLHHRLRSPLLVVAERTPSGFAVSDQVVHRSGDGATLAKALDEYSFVLLDYFTDLRRNRARLSPRLSRHLEKLKAMIAQV